MTRADHRNTASTIEAQALQNSAESPLKILMVAPTSFFGDYGGHIRMYEETLALQKAGHKVIFVTYHMGRNLDGFDIRRTPPLPYRSNYEVGSSRHKIAFDAFLFIRTLQVALKERPDVIHGHMHEGALIGAPIARLLKIPLIFDYQGSLTGEMVDHDFLDPQGKLFPWLVRLERRICEMAGVILTSSSRAQELLRFDFGIDPTNIAALPDCIDTSRFNPGLFDKTNRDALRVELGIPLDVPIVAYLGLLADYQGTDHILRAAALLKLQGVKVHFLIMGWPSVEFYRTMAVDLGVADMVTFTGKVRYDLAPRYLSIGDIFVSAKMSSTEGSGKVLNYMAMGRPTVAYDSQVHREYLGDAGIYPPSGDVEALSAEIGALLQDPKRSRALGKALRERAETHFSWKSSMQMVVGKYRMLIAKRAKSKRVA